MRPSKRDELVRAALDAFQSGGFHATGVDALAAVAGMSKTSIYNHFDAKEDVILAALDLRHGEVLAAFAAHMDEAGEAPRARIIGFFAALADWFAAPNFCGCAFIKAAAEHQRAADPIREAARAHKRDMEALLAVETARLPVADPAALARMLMILSEGAIVRSHMGLGDDSAADARAGAEALIDAALATAG